MPEINCHIPIRVKIRGKPSEDDLEALENRLGDLCVSAIKRSLTELIKSHSTEQEKSPVHETGSL